MSITLLVVFTASIVEAADPAVNSVDSNGKWIVKVTGYAGEDHDSVIVGYVPNTTDGFNQGYDATSLFKAGLHFALYMNRPDWAQNTPYAWIDVTSPTDMHDWVFHVYTAELGTSVVLGWDASQVPAGLNVELIDNYTGVNVNMKEVEKYSFTSVENNRGFTVKVTSAGN